MLDALRRLGVEASGEGTGAVADDPAVAAVIAALVLADHPGDTIAAFHVAGSPLGPVIGLRTREPAESLAVSRRLRQDLVERGAAVVLAEWARALRRRGRHAREDAVGAGGGSRRAVRTGRRRSTRRSRRLPVARRGREPAPGGRARDDDPSRQGPRVRRRGAARARSSVAAAPSRAGVSAASLAAGAGGSGAPLGRGQRAAAGAGARGRPSAGVGSPPARRLERALCRAHAREAGALPVDRAERRGAGSRGRPGASELRGDPARHLDGHHRGSAWRCCRR